MKKLLPVAATLVRRLGYLGLGSGILAGGLLTAPLVGLMYLVDKLAGLPFVPFALFDWIARVDPRSRRFLPCSTLTSPALRRGLHASRP